MIKLYGFKIGHNRRSRYSRLKKQLTNQLSVKYESMVLPGIADADESC